ncbi:MAG: carbonic anhydrase [Verrucomicrobiae bacterium]|nr:carbonic anhydrase [Verrucomicrobiae bacterium]NNJ85699.1 carbonic anhydrase [Akkermansiaceae bacterium]
MKTTALLISSALLSLTPFASAQTTAEAQKALTPSAVLDDLMAGNKRFTENKLTPKNVPERIAKTSTGQYPKAVILSCLDSRVPVEKVFDQGIGDIFVGRVAGNVENTDQLGSMEFATKLAGSKLIMVLGHTACGAVKGACDGAEMGNLTGLLKKIEPAVRAVEGYKPEERNSKNIEFVNKVVTKNVQQTVADIRSRSEVLSQLEKEGKIKIVGAVYDLKTGKVTLLDS